MGTLINRSGEESKYGQSVGASPGNCAFTFYQKPFFSISEIEL